MKSDYLIENHGSIILLRPTNAYARQFLSESVDSEAQWFAGALAVEPLHRMNNLVPAVLIGILLLSTLLVGTLIVVLP